MAQKRTNDDFDFDRVPGGGDSSAPGGMEDFDIFNFSSADLDAAGIGHVHDDLDLDSFLNFDEPMEPEESETAPAEEAAETEADAEAERARQSERQARRARRETAFAELFGSPETEEEAEPEEEPEPPRPKKKGRSRRKNAVREEEPAALEAEEPESAPSETAEDAEPEEEPEPPRPKKKGRGRRKNAVREEEPAAWDAEEPTAFQPEADIAVPEAESEPDFMPDTAEKPETGISEDAPYRQFPSEPAEEPFGEEDAGPEYADGEEKPRRMGFLARFKKKSAPREDELPEEAQDGETPDEEPGEKRQSFFRSIFFRPRDEGEEDAESEDEPGSEKPEDKPAGAKISFFTRLSPEKEKFEALMRAKKEEEKPRRRREIAAADNEALAAQLPREPKRSEMLVYDSELDDLDYIDADDLPETRDYLPIRFRRYGRSGIGGGLMYAVFVISISIILACFGWLCAADVLALSKDEVHAVVVVESYTPGDTDTLNEDGKPVNEKGNVITCDIDQVADALKEGDIINFKFLFKLFSKLSHANTKIDPGTYDVSTKLDYRALITEMQTGSDSQEITKITFPEGYRMEQIFELLEDNNICSYDDLMEAAAEHDYSYSWLEEDWYLNAKGDPTRLEGYLFPDTYEFYQGENAVNVINRFLLRFHGLLTQDMYQQAENRGVTLHEAVIIASLIEKEAGPEDDRSNFSSVIFNRLNSGWKLQLDSTVNYIKNTSTFNLSNADLSIDNPYNTYVYEGLPKGPICSPGLASINAALNPNSTDYWFWYAYEGVTHFFTNNSDFDAFAEAHPYN